MHNKIDEKGKNKNFAFSVLRDHIIESILGKNIKNIKNHQSWPLPAQFVFITRQRDFQLLSTSVELGVGHCQLSLSLQTGTETDRQTDRSIYLIFVLLVVVWVQLACLVYCNEFANCKYRFWPIFLYNFFTKRLKILVKVMENF